MSVLPGSVKIAVYTGLTLKAAEVLELLPTASVRPPVKQFDVLHDIRERYHVVVIIDGVFHQTPAVSPSEIMDALRRGMLVYGCSSMGALRAAELWPHGMHGHGKIFEWAKSDRNFRDDFPGQAFSNEGGEMRALSITYVDFVFNLIRLHEEGHVSTTDRRYLEMTFRNIFYPERTVGAMMARLKKTRPDLASVARTALTELGSQKRRDALATLERVRNDLSAVEALNHELAAAPPHRPAAVRALSRRRGMNRGARHEQG